MQDEASKSTTMPRFKIWNLKIVCGASISLHTNPLTISIPPGLSRPPTAARLCRTMSELDISELLVDDAKREVREMLHSVRSRPLPRSRAILWAVVAHARCNPPSPPVDKPPASPPPLPRSPTISSTAAGNALFSIHRCRNR